MHLHASRKGSWELCGLPFLACLTCIVKFANFKEHDRSFMHAKLSRNTHSSHVIIYQDFSSQFTQKQQELWLMLQQVRHEGVRCLHNIWRNWGSQTSTTKTSLQPAAPCWKRPCETATCIHKRPDLGCTCPSCTYCTSMPVASAGGFNKSTTVMTTPTMTAKIHASTNQPKITTDTSKKNQTHEANSIDPNTSNDSAAIKQFQIWTASLGLLVTLLHDAHHPSLWLRQQSLPDSTPVNLPRTVSDINNRSIHLCLSPDSSVNHVPQPLIIDDLFTCVDVHNYCNICRFVHYNCDFSHDSRW